ncbi:MAG: hypothetical protein WA476_02255, partial [Acidobacteriaceae bacterium]
MLPAKQRLDAGDASCGDLHLWLVDQEELAGVQRGAQIIFKGELGYGCAVHPVSEHANPVAAIVFGAVHRGVGIPDQCFSIFSVIGKDADADAAGGAEHVAANEKGSGDGIHDAVRGQFRFGRTLDTAEHNQKFIAAQA